MKNLMIMREEDGGGASPSAVDLMSDSASVTEPTQTTTTPPTQPSFQIDHKALATEFASAIKPHLPAQPQPQMTPEQAREALGFFKFTPEYLTRYDNLESRAAAMEEHYNNIMSVSTSIARGIVQQELEKLRGELTPMQQHYAQVQADAREARFGKAYPALAHANLKQLVHGVAASLGQQGAFNGKDEAAAFKLIAEHAANVIKQHNPNFQLDAAPPTGGHIPTTSSGSGGTGGGGQKSANAGKPLGVRLLS